MLVPSSLVELVEMGCVMFFEFLCVGFLGEFIIAICELYDLYFEVGVGCKAWGVELFIN